MANATSFNPPWWLCNRHLQSCYGSIFGVKSEVNLRWEELLTPDNDFVDICWGGQPDKPIVVLLHGLEGSVHSHYIQAMVETLEQCGWQFVVLNYRTCSGRLNRLPQGYHGGDTRDLTHLINVIKIRHPHLPIAAVGFSLGGNILMQYLVQQPNAPLVAAVSISTPFDLGKAADYLSPFYQRVLLRSMKHKVITKIKLGYQFSVGVDQVDNITSLREFDSLITAPLFGFSSVDEYYHGVSCGTVLHRIKHPTLIMHALDDPFIPPDSVPKDHQLSLSTILEITEKGGHVGFIRGGTPWRPEYWFEERVPRFLREYLF